MLENEGLQRNASEIDDYLEHALATIECPAMRDVGGCGLFLGTERVRDRTEKSPGRGGAQRVVNRLEDEGFPIGTSVSCDATLKRRPPLVFGRKHADAFPVVFDEMVRKLY